MLQNHMMKKKKPLCTFKLEQPSPDKRVPQSSEEIQVVSETSFVDSSCVEDHSAKRANILLSCTAYSVKAALSSKKDESNHISKPSEVKVMTSTQKCGKNTFSWSFSSISSGEPVIVSETSEESMPCNPSSALASLEKKRQKSTQVFPVDYTSKYIQKRKLTQSGSGHSDDTTVIAGHAPLLSRVETTLKSTRESETKKKFAKRS